MKQWFCHICGYSCYHRAAMQIVIRSIADGSTVHAERGAYFIENSKRFFYTVFPVRPSAYDSRSMQFGFGAIFPYLSFQYKWKVPHTLVNLCAMRTRRYIRVECTTCWEWCPHTTQAPCNLDLVRYSPFLTFNVSNGCPHMMQPLHDPDLIQTWNNI